MIIIPAIDLKNGKCVRLLQGRDDATTEYSDDPVAMAHDWVRQGATRLHVVNLDGAFGRASDNMDVFAKIAGEVDCLLEFGGGLRNVDDLARAIESGADKVVIGTAAIERPDIVSEALARWGSDRVIVALDGVKGNVATRGWKEVTNLTVVDAAASLRSRGLREVLYTDVSRDGMMTGVDIPTTRRIGEAGIGVIASGGIGSLDDIRALASASIPNIVGVIVGKALYERKFTFVEAAAVVSGE